MVIQVLKPYGLHNPMHYYVGLLYHYLLLTLRTREFLTISTFVDSLAKIIFKITARYEIRKRTYVEKLQVLNSGLIVTGVMNHRVIDNGAVATPRDRNQNPGNRQNPHCVITNFGCSADDGFCKTSKVNHSS